MFGAIIGIAAKVIGGGALSGGGGILGGLLGGGGGGGILSSLFKGGPAQEIFNMVSSFKSNFLGGASQQPPVGGFGQSNNAQGGDQAVDRLTSKIERLLDRLESLRSQQQGGSGFDGIRDLLRQFLDSSGSRSQVSFQFSRSQYTNMQV